MIGQDCLACHSGHQEPKLTRRSRKPFSHDLLKVVVGDTCSSCHAAPKDTVHRGLKVECSKCHQRKAWKPATFDHNMYFVLDRDHDASCETCHKDNCYSRHTCYGCQEHSQAKIRAEHVEEGIQNFEYCVECRRDPRVEPDKRGGGERGKKERD